MNNQKHLQSKFPFIALYDIGIACNGKVFFADLNWVIENNQHWAILGPNGSGKSLLAKAICRNIPLSNGRIEYFFDQTLDGQPFFNRGEVVMIAPEQQKDLLQRYGGYHQSRWQSFEGDEVPTVDHFLSGNSIEHFSPFEVTPLRTDQAIYRDRRQKALKLLEIEYLLERKLHQLSNGESRKVFIARALMQQPKLLILDDPYGGLDISAREILKQVIGKLLTESHSRIIFITSRSEEIPEKITHILHIDCHHKITQDSKENILTSLLPQSQEVTANFNATISNLENAVDACRSTSNSFSEFHVDQLEIDVDYSKIPDFQPHWQTKNPILVELKNVSVSYQGVKVLSNIHWRVNQGERWVIMGPNGAGKTTLLSLILADNPQSYSNEIYLFGRKRGSGESIWDIKQHLGWVSPELLIYYQTGQTCFEVACSGFYDSVGLFRECSPVQLQRVRDWFRFLNLDSLIKLPFGEVSMGEQRLILLARALVKNPPLLILDEPCQGLDIQHRSQILGLLDHICQQSRISMIYVTHHQNELPKTTTHFLRLKNGEILEIGPLTALR